ncbi:adenylyl-sulfate kinase [Alicyclobacillus acidoterrestris]|uniref:Adenylyl-sulfate kinase n=1 Tax=Alicyclobacillus acidoterrestris (strain ATCC 49025 / DSM 3922 / CIP 106132 / NCIMB 13137 / GD3B) TaxID=1356854 RepID=T0BFF5_ALIAG|nr:hypothetical protein N007_14350 [Alicyclobacillus acidoterrestris ATCC 49025]UNO50111.1 adenylyl-sulfate kinase [Alicyclobacillus acidoterrestris]
MSCVVWLTGLSGSGKTTIAYALHDALHKRGVVSFVIDGDKVRKGLNSDLGFSPADRQENVRRIGALAKLLMDDGVLPIVASISPQREDRDRVRRQIGEDKFIEVYVNCPIEVCEQRDPKGLYKKVRMGEIQQFTGIHQTYEAPLHPDLVIKSDQVSVDEAVQSILPRLCNQLA